jgi:hypothetical protein
LRVIAGNVDTVSGSQDGCVYRSTLALAFEHVDVHICHVLVVLRCRDSRSRPRALHKMAEGTTAAVVLRPAQHQHTTSIMPVHVRLPR